MAAVAVSLLEAERLPQPSAPAGHPIRCTAIPRSQGPRRSKLPRKLEPPPPPRPSRRSILGEPSPAGLKRARPPSDVDGPNTLHASRKKRRLRSRPITSPLARPFSQPPTHIPHHASRPAPGPVPRPHKTTTPTATSAIGVRGVRATRSCSYLRFSLMNRLRKRLGIQIHRHALHAARDGETSARTPWLPPDDPVSAAHAPACLAFPLSKSPGAVSLPSADHAATIERIASRIISPAPLDQPRRPSGDDIDDEVKEGDEDGFAFLHLGCEFMIDDEGEDGADHVYCDFDAVFGARAVSSEQGGDRLTYEENMDDLDGISWRIR